MNKNLLHTPEGVRDIYGNEFAGKTACEAQIHEVMRQFGFEDIQTPTFEFFDVFSREIGTTPSKDLYKFFDKEGNTLVLRPDFTPSIARCAAKYYMDTDMSVRFCYKGNTFTNTSNLQGKLKEVTEMGAELIGDGSVLADAEMIALCVQALLKSGLTNFQVSIGEIDYIKGLCAQAGLDDDAQMELRELISIKNFYRAQELLKNYGVSSDIVKTIMEIGNLVGQADILDEAMKLASNEVSKGAVKRLKDLYQMLKVYGVDKYVSFDLGMVSKYHYYTGIIFKAYTYGVGDAVVKGGRYDKLLEQFGKPSAAIGFVIVIDDLLSALKGAGVENSTQNEQDKVLIYEKEAYEEAVTYVLKEREKQTCISMMPADEQNIKETIAFVKNCGKEPVVLKAAWKGLL